MRPLALSLISGAASIVFAAASHTFASKLELTHISTPALFSTLLIALFFLIATCASLWICLSYLLLAYAQHSRPHFGTVLTYVSRLATPNVRRALAGTIAVSLLVAQPAYADEYDDTQSVTVADISWGSPDLLEITAENETVESANADTTTDDSTSATHDDAPTLPIPATQTPSDTHPSPAPHTNPLTSTPTPAPADTSNTQYTSELPSDTPSPPHTSTHASYTVKSGDTLWDIAATYLPAQATDGDIARACLAWNAANPTLVNPNLIYPGQQLAIPQEALL